MDLISSSPPSGGPLMGHGVIAKLSENLHSRYIILGEEKNVLCKYTHFLKQI